MNRFLFLRFKKKKNSERVVFDLNLRFSGELMRSKKGIHTHYVNLYDVGTSFNFVQRLWKLKSEESILFDVEYKFNVYFSH